MKNTYAVALFVGVVLVGFGPPALAQGNQEGQLVQIVEYFVEPGKAADFEAARQSQVALWGEHGFSYGGQISVTPGFVYREVRILGDWEDFGRRREQLQAMPNRGLAPGLGVHHHRRSSILQTHPDLTYAPENPREGVTIGDVGFIHYVFLHFRPGTRTAALELVSEATAMLREHDIRDNVIVTSTVVADDAPFVLFRFHAKDQQAYYANWAENDATLGEEFANIRRQLGALARHIEVADHTVRRDLSYQPAPGALGASSDPFVGTWSLNVAESSYSPGSGPREMTRVYVDRGDGVFLITNEGTDPQGEPIFNQMAIKFDGRPYPIAARNQPVNVTISERRLSDRSVEYVVRADGQTVTTTTRALSDDGQTITERTTGTSPQGQSVNNTVVWNRQ